MIKCIFAIGANGEFGNKGKLPWKHCPEDMKHFQQYTFGQVVVMGRNTWNSLPPKKLPDRMCFVVDRGEQNEYNNACENGVEYVDVKTKDLHQFLYDLSSVSGQSGMDVIVIGGMSLILDAIQVADEASITIVGYQDFYECDVMFPEDFVDALHKIVFENSCGNVLFEDSEAYVHQFDVSLNTVPGMLLKQVAMMCKEDYS